MPCNGNQAAGSAVVTLQVLYGRREIGCRRNICVIHLLPVDCFFDRMIHGFTRVSIAERVDILGDKTDNRRGAFAYQVYPQVARLPTRRILNSTVLQNGVKHVT